MTKELRDYLIKTYGNINNLSDRILELTYPKEIAAYEAGYEQAMNDNAPQWHYIKDKDYPKCNELVIALDCKNEYAILYYEDLKERGGTSWHTVERFTYARNIVAWQYIEPPKEM